ncbi:MBL fold metallo-hydrolase [Piscibacillus halophilus]|uniref:MBL fold metallo-hydrolase n=1 Tax=Piscibacillus halophilus TaxID=571933 RepID=UPI0015886E2E|nr:MBL fold metallo-hydrolase [Piscibacillus halophilus]
MTNEIHRITLPTPYPVGDVHAYIVKNDTVTLIDAGVHTNEAWTSFKEQLKNINLAPEDIDQIVLTHHHPDHIGLVGRLDHVDAIYGHHLVHKWLTRDEEYINHYLNFFNDLYFRWGVPERFRNMEKTLQNTLAFTTTSELTDVLTEGDEVPGLDGFVTLGTPGHAESHLSFYHNETNEFLAGDFLLKHISSNPLLEPPMNKGEERPKPLLKYRESMKKVLGYTFSNIYPGHGDIFSDHRDLIIERLAKQEKRSKKVLDYIRHSPATPFEICQYLFPKHYQSQFGLTMSETVGQLDYLCSLGKITELDQEGPTRFIARHKVTSDM